MYKWLCRCPEVADLVNDSRKAKEGSLFFCIKGAVSDGHKYAADVIAKASKKFWSCRMK